MSERLSRLFKPKSIAVIGGGAWSVSVIKNLLRSGFQGEIWPVHPKREELGGVKTVKSLSDLAGVPDASFVAVNRNLTLEVIGDLARMGAGGAVCFASGFLESDAETQDGAELQGRLIDAAGEMPIIGPNCYGFLNYLDNVWLWPDQHGGLHQESGVAILAQSSNIAINLTMQKRGLPIAFVGTVGNQAQIDMCEMGSFLLDDPRITALGLYIEGIKSLRSFEALARMAYEKGKHIVVLKVGRSEQAQAATVSHTASLAGSAAGSSALFKRLGVAEVTDAATLLESLKILHLIGPLPSNRIVSLSCSGGEASLMADISHNRTITFPALSPLQARDLHEALGDAVKLANPLDYHTYIWGDVKAMSDTYAAASSDDVAVTIIVVDIPREDICDPSAWDCVMQAVSEASTRTGRRYALLSSLPENMPEAVAMQMMENGILPLNGMVEAISAIEATSQIFAPSCHPVTLAVSQDKTRDVSENDAKAVLREYGLKTPNSIVATATSDTLTELNVLNYPVVVKGIGLAHKSEAGAVILSVETPQAAIEAIKSIQSESHLVEEMVLGGVVELLVGVLGDPTSGFILTLGAGGVLTEVLQDVAHLLVPASEEEIEDALSRLKIAPLINGYRGKPAAHKPSIIAAIKALQDYVIAHADHIQEVEINPLIVTSTEAIAADALIRIGESQ